MVPLLVNVNRQLHLTRQHVTRNGEGIVTRRRLLVLKYGNRVLLRPFRLTLTRFSEEVVERATVRRTIISTSVVRVTAVRKGVNEARVLLPLPTMRYLSVLVIVTSCKRRTRLKETRYLTCLALRLNIMTTVVLRIVARTRSVCKDSNEGTLSNLLSVYRHLYNRSFCVALLSKVVVQEDVMKTMNVNGLQITSSCRLVAHLLTTERSPRNGIVGLFLIKGDLMGADHTINDQVNEGLRLNERKGVSRTDRTIPLRLVSSSKVNFRAFRTVTRSGTDRAISLNVFWEAESVRVSLRRELFHLRHVHRRHNDHIVRCLISGERRVVLPRVRNGSCDRGGTTSRSSRTYVRLFFVRFSSCAVAFSIMLLLRSEDCQIANAFNVRRGDLNATRFRRRVRTGESIILVIHSVRVRGLLPLLVLVLLVFRARATMFSTIVYLRNRLTTVLRLNEDTATAVASERFRTVAFLPINEIRATNARRSIRRVGSAIVVEVLLPSILAVLILVVRICVTVTTNVIMRGLVRNVSLTFTNSLTRVRQDRVNTYVTRRNVTRGRRVIRSLVATNCRQAAVN